MERGRWIVGGFASELEGLADITVAVRAVAVVIRTKAGGCGDPKAESLWLNIVY